MPKAQPSEFLSITEAATIIGVSSKTLRRWEDEGKITPARTLGNQRRYHRDHVEKMKANAVKLHSPYLSVAKTATFLGVSQKTLSRWESEGHLHKIKINSTMKGYPRSEVEKIVRRHEKSDKRGRSETFSFSQGFSGAEKSHQSNSHAHYQKPSHIQDSHSLSNLSTLSILSNLSETTNHSLKSTGKQDNRRTGKLIKVLCIVLLILALSPVITNTLRSSSKEFFIGVLEPAIIDIYKRNGFDKPLTNILIPGTLTNSSTDPENLLQDLGLPTPTALPDSTTLPEK